MRKKMGNEEEEQHLRISVKSEEKSKDILAWYSVTMKWYLQDELDTVRKMEGKYWYNE